MYKLSFAFRITFPPLWLLPAAISIGKQPTADANAVWLFQCAVFFSSSYIYTMYAPSLECHCEKIRTSELLIPSVVQPILHTACQCQSPSFPGANTSTLRWCKIHLIFLI